MFGERSWGGLVGVGFLVSLLVGCGGDAASLVADAGSEDLGGGQQVTDSTSQSDSADGLAAEIIASGPDVGDASQGDSIENVEDNGVAADSALPDTVPADSAATGDTEGGDSDAEPDVAAGVDVGNTADTFEPPGPTPACRGEDPRFWQDLSGNGHHGTFFDLDETVFWGGDGTVDSPFSLELGGTPGPRVELQDAAPLRLSSGSVEFWLRAASTTFANKMVDNHRDSGGVAGVVLISQDGHWKGLGTDSDAGWATAFAAPGHEIGLWQHVVLTWEYIDVDESTTLRIFIDGVETASSAIDGSVFYGPKGRPQIGGLNGGWGSFHGGMALARIWGGVLGAAEVLGLFNDSAADRFGRVPLAGDVASPAAALLAWFDAAPCP